MAKKSTLDIDYTTGSLSNFPTTVDTKETLYEVKNNAESKLRASLGFNSKIIILENTSSFPDQGIIRIGPPAGVAGSYELIYYGSKLNNILSNLTRGFVGSIQKQWPAGSYVTNAVCAEPHNAIKDAIVNIENFIGTKDNPEGGTLHARLIDLENKFLAPRAFFRAYPKSCRPGIGIKFQTFCDGNVIRYLWDFGDGTQSVEKNPTHIYYSEGLYSITLNIITYSGAQGIYTKNNYVYVSNTEGSTFLYSVKAGDKTYKLIDQSDGEIKQRYWIFGDGQTYVENDPNIHTVTHQYSAEGSYTPSLLISFANNTLKRVNLTDKELIVQI